MIMTDFRSRRELLGLSGAAGLALAGCTDLLDDDAEEVDVADDAAWRTETLEDVQTGEQFTITELDQPVLIHPFGEWCSSCRSQQQDFAELHDRRGDDIAIIDVSIVEGDGPDVVRQHAENNGFEWRFSVSPEPVTESLVDDFGSSVTSPPSSPVVVHCPNGTTLDVPKGQDADELEELIDEHCR